MIDSVEDILIFVEVVELVVDMLVVELEIVLVEVKKVVLKVKVSFKVKFVEVDVFFVINVVVMVLVNVDDDVLLK